MLANRALGESHVVGDDFLVHLLLIVNEIDLVDGQHDMADAGGVRRYRSGAGSAGECPAGCR